MRKFILHPSSFILILLLAPCPLPLATVFGQEIIDSVPIHPRYSYDPAKTMWSWQQGQNGTGHEVDFLDKNGVPKCWADADGQLNCTGQFGAETIQKNGTFVGTQPIINFIEGTNITITAVNDVANNRVNLTFTASGGGVCSDLAQATDWYVDSAGSDTTGDGTPGLPWKNPQHAIDQIGFLVCGKYTIHLAHGTYTVSGANSIHIDGRAFGGGGVDGWNAAAPPGGTYWPWESAWIEIVGDPTPGLEYSQGDGDSIDSYILDHNGACDGLAAVSISGGNLVLRGLSVRNGGFGLLAHSSKVKVAGVSFQHNCTDIDAGYSSLIYHDKEDLDTGSWCGDTFCWYAEFRNQAQLAKNWGILLHDFSLQSDETADDSGDSSSSGLNFTCIGACGTTGQRIAGSLFDAGARLSMAGTWNADTSAITTGIVRTLIQKESVFDVSDVYFDNVGYTNCGVPPCGGPMLWAKEGSIIRIDAGGSIKNAAKGVEIDTGSKLIYEPTFTNVTTPTVSGTPSYLSVD